MRLLGGRYRLYDRLGTGGMSVVWRAHDEILNRAVAIKLLVVPDAGARARILAEAQAAAGIWHPHVTNVYDYGEALDDDGTVRPYIVMELLPGRTLYARLATGPLPPRLALRACAEVASALAAAHAAGLVHRDVKPSNIMLTPSGAKVFDFGIAASAGHPDLDPEGQVYGTPAYVAPERLTDDMVLPASDVYSLGMLIYRSLTGRLPWTADTTTGLIDAHENIEPERLPYIEGVGPEVEDVYLHCLAVNPDDRPPAEEVAAVLALAAGITMPADDAVTAESPLLPDPRTATAAVTDSGLVRRRPGVVRPPAEGPAGDGWPETAEGRPGATEGRSPAAEGRPATHRRPEPGVTKVGPPPNDAPPARRRRRGLLAAIGALAVVAVTAASLSLDDDSPGSHSARATVSSHPSARRSPPLSPTPASAAPGSGGTPGSATPAPTGATGTVPPTGKQPVTSSPTPARGGGGSTPTPTPTPTPSPTQSQVVRVTSEGGEVQVTCFGDQARMVSEKAYAGYTLSLYHDGPADQVKAVFSATQLRSTITSTCVNGQPAPLVRETTAPH